MVTTLREKFYKARREEDARNAQRNADESIFNTEEQTNGLVVVSLNLPKDHLRKYKMNDNLRIEDGFRITYGLRTYAFNEKFFPTTYQTQQFEQIVEAWEQAWRDEYYIKTTTEDGREVEVINTEGPFLQACVGE